MISFLHILRPKNLVLVAITQVILYQTILVTHISNSILDYWHFGLLVLDTILIAAGGYVINDIYDYTNDLVNKPSRTFIPSPILLRQAWIYYTFIVVLGGGLALYLAIYINNIPLFILYPSAVILLYYYSKYFKNSVLTGNIIVSLFVAFVSGIILFADRAAVGQISDLYARRFVIEMFLVYMIFSFLSNLIREIVKDIEDIDGDKLSNLTTLPIKYGTTLAKRICIVLASLTIVLIVCWLFFTPLEVNFRAKSFICIFIIAPLIISIQILVKATEKRAFSRLSSLIKWIMLSGLISIIIITQ